VQLCCGVTGKSRCENGSNPGEEELREMGETKILLPSLPPSLPFLFSETGCHYVAQANLKLLKLLSSNNPPASISQVARAIGIHHHTQLT
jgi:hypothetical protein